MLKQRPPLLSQPQSYIQQRYSNSFTWQSEPPLSSCAYVLCCVLPPPLLPALNSLDTAHAYMSSDRSGVPVLWLQVSYCSPACQHAAGGASSSAKTLPAASSSTAATAARGTATATAAPAPTASVAAGLQAGISCAEHAPGGLECGRPWVRLLREEAVLASRCLRARAAAAAVVAPAVESGAAEAEQQLPQQWQELCRQQQQLQLDVLSATLLDSLVYHPSPRTISCSSRLKATETEAVRIQQQQEVEQLVLATLVFQVHAQAADKQRTTSAASKAAPSSRHCESAPAAAVAAAPPAADPAAVLKVLQQLVANGIAIKPFLSSGPEDRWGLGLYPVTAAVVNHSCDPNCSIRCASAANGNPFMQHPTCATVGA